MRVGALVRVGSAVAAVAIAGCGGDPTPSACPAHFDTQKWVTTPPGPERQRLAREVVACRYVRHGDTKRQVAEVLGRAQRDETQSRGEYRYEWYYYVGDVDGTMGPAFAQALSVRFNPPTRVSEISVDP